MRIREIKGKLEEREKDFWTLRNPGEKRRRKETREKGERETNPSLKPTSFEEKWRRSCISKGSHIQNHL